MRHEVVVSSHSDVSSGMPVYPVYVMSCIHLRYVSPSRPLRHRGNPGHVLTAWSFNLTETLVIQTCHRDLKLYI